MNPELLKLVLEDLLEHEGCVPWLYCDSRGLVTIGVGNLVKTERDVVNLPLHHLNTGVVATDEEKVASWRRVHESYSKGASAEAYRKHTDLRITREYATERVRERVTTEFLPAMHRLFHSFDSWPWSAQRAALDMVYSLGVRGMDGISHYPDMVAAGQRGDFAGMARECVRSSGRRAPSKGDPEGLGPRNIWTRDRFLQAAKEVG